jgi:hypothetical protein
MLAALAVAVVAVFTASCLCAQGDDATAKRRPWRVVIVNEVDPLSTARTAQQDDGFLDQRTLHNLRLEASQCKELERYVRVAYLCGMTDGPRVFTARFWAVRGEVI